MVAFVVLYIVSAGPLCWVLERRGRADLIEPILHTLYGPVLWAVHDSAWLADLFSCYLYSCHGLLNTWILPP
jgi:hypothetical protein